MNDSQYHELNRKLENLSTWVRWLTLSVGALAGLMGARGISTLAGVGF